MHEMNDDAIACSLGSDDLETQTALWTRLCSTAGVRRAMTENGARLEFRATPAVESELRALVSAERECCAWATWTITREASLLVLEVVSTAAGAEALHGMFQPRSMQAQ
jgi:hypothetical protein